MTLNSYPLSTKTLKKTGKTQKFWFPPKRWEITIWHQLAFLKIREKLYMKTRQSLELFTQFILSVIHTYVRVHAKILSNIIRCWDFQTHLNNSYNTWIIFFVSRIQIRKWTLVRTTFHPKHSKEISTKRITSSCFIISHNQ